MIGFVRVNFASIHDIFCQICDKFRFLKILSIWFFANPRGIRFSDYRNSNCTQNESFDKISTFYKEYWSKMMYYCCMTNLNKRNLIENVKIEWTQARTTSLWHHRIDQSITIGYHRSNQQIRQEIEFKTKHLIPKITNTGKNHKNKWEKGNFSLNVSTNIAHQGRLS